MRQRYQGTCYTCFIKSTQRTLVSTSMQQLANKLDIHPRTIARHLRKSRLYITDEWIIEKDVKILVISRGFNKG